MHPVIVKFDGEDLFSVNPCKDLYLPAVEFPALQEDLLQVVMFVTAFQGLTTHQGTNRSWNDFTSRSL
jgi:hypothetical protein